MTRLTLKVSVALLTFALGVGCAYLWLFERGASDVRQVSAPEQASQPAREWPPEVPFCLLVYYPDAYDGKTVRVRANYATGMHGAVIRDLSCLSTNAQVWVKLSPPMWEELRDEIDRARGPVDVEFVGRFARNHPAHTSDSLEDTALYRFELKEIVSASKPR